MDDADCTGLGQDNHSQQGFTHLAITPGTAGGLPVVAGDDRGVAGACEAARPRHLVAAHLFFKAHVFFIEIT